MKNQIFISLVTIFILISCNSSKIMVKSSYYEGKDNVLKRYNEYNSKSKKAISIINGVRTEKKVSLTSEDKKYFKSLISRLNLNKNFCFKSLTTYPDYTWKFEIVLNEKENMPECKTDNVDYELYEAYNTIKDTIRKRSK